MSRLGTQKDQDVAASEHFYSLAVTLLLIGAGLRVWQFGIGAALWHDELALARNLVEKSLHELLTAPLDYAQVAPLGFLLVEKAAIEVFGNNELALRLFPLLCALISLPLFAVVASQVLPRGAALLGVGLFALSPALIGFGSQLKQYSTDVAAALLMTALTLRWWERRSVVPDRREAVLLGSTGLLAVWLSHAVVLVLAGLALSLLIEALRRRDWASLRSLLPVAICWAAAGLIGVASGVHTMSPSTRAFMEVYWAEGFLPLPPWSGSDALWLWRAFRAFFQRQFLYPLPAMGVFLMLLGALALARRRLWYALVALAPVGIALLASAARQYPFGDRVSFFLLPSMLLLVAAGIDLARHAGAAWWRPLGTIVVALALAAPAHALYAYYPMYPKQPMSDVLAYVQARRQPDDAVYVYIGAQHAVAYYGPRFGLPPEAVVIGGCPRDGVRGLLRDLDQFRGRPRLWLIVSHAIGPSRERETMLSYLDAIGIRRDGISVGDSRLSPSAHLYDLSEPDRLRASSAETQTLPARLVGAREYSCIADAPRTR
jgi:hypothetical protein